MVFVLLIANVVLLVRQFRKFRKGRSRRRAVLVFVGLSLILPVLYLLGFIAAVGLEEPTGWALISEGMGRVLFPVLALSVAATSLGTMILAVLVWVLKPGAN